MKLLVPGGGFEPSRSKEATDSQSVAVDQTAPSRHFLIFDRYIFN
jgi:hypothetical protein